MAQRLRLWPWWVLAAWLMLAGCASGPRGDALLDMSEQELFQLGKDAMERGDELQAREYLRRYEVRYPRGAHIEEVKFLIATSYYHRRMNEEKVEGIALYRSFLTFYPRHQLACEAQYQIADYYASRMRSPERDQTETRQTIQEAQKLVTSYPECVRVADAQAILQRAYDRLAESEFKVAEFQLKTGVTEGAEHRLRDLIANYPQFSERDKVYYLWVAALKRLGRTSEALEVLRQFEVELPQSPYVARARRELDLPTGG